MGKRPRKPSFADIVRDVKESPDPRAQQYTHPGMQPDRTFVDQGGRVFHELHDVVTPAYARELAASGALVVWDSCGCGGYCGFEWLEPAAVARLAASGPPNPRSNKRSGGGIAEWVAEDGSSLLLMWGNVGWGDELA
jgi:hypothetical protein